MASSQHLLSCRSYLAPSPNQVVQAFDPVVLGWDPDCLQEHGAIDIYLQSLDAASPIHAWKSVASAAGRLSTVFAPEWWNSTSDVPLQLVITPANLPVWAGYGPSSTFYGHFNGTVPSGSRNHHSTTQAPGFSVEVLNSYRDRSHGLSRHALGAAVVLPILAVVCSIVAFVFISRKRSGEANKRWSQFVEQRMSTLAGTEWEFAPPPSLRSLPRSRAESIMRHSASLPPRPNSQIRLSTCSVSHRASALNPGLSRYSAASAPRISGFQATPPPSFAGGTSTTRESKVSFAGVSMSGCRKSTVSFADPSPLAGSRSHKSSLNLCIAPPRLSTSTSDFALSPTQHSGPSVLGGDVGRRASSNLKFGHQKSSSLGSLRPGHSAKSPSMARSASNLRFELDPEPAVEQGSAPASSQSANPRKPLSIRQPSVSAWSAESFKLGNTASSTPLNNVPFPGSGMPGMSTLEGNISSLSPDEALKQYTLSRKRTLDQLSSARTAKSD